MRIYGLFNCTTKEKVIHRSHDLFLQAGLAPDTNGLPCGVYRFAEHSIECKECDGKGVGEEVSGGHKKECEACSGTGIDPDLLKAFEELPSPSRLWTAWGWLSAWTTHSAQSAWPKCKKCDDCWKEFLLTKDNQI